MGGVPRTWFVIGLDAAAELVLSLPPYPESLRTDWWFSSIFLPLIITSRDHGTLGAELKRVRHHPGPLQGMTF